MSACGHTIVVDYRSMHLSQVELTRLVEGKESSPHSFLGQHLLSPGGYVVRSLLPGAITCELIKEGETKGIPMKKIHSLGIFEEEVKSKSAFRYQFKVTYPEKITHLIEDPYRFLPTLSESDLFLIGKGDDHKVYHKLGSHLATIDGVMGVRFAVWAPSARRVSLVGNHNFWNGRTHPMRLLGASGIWEIFIPGLTAGACYKYEIVGPADETPFLKTDPYALSFEAPPHHAAIVTDLSGFAWHDSEWIKKRYQTSSQQQPISIYEVHLGSWRQVPEDNNRPLNYKELGIQLAEYCNRLGFTHVELMPPTEHPFEGSWGYQVTGFYAPTHRLGSPLDFMMLVDTLHRANIGVIIDWVPAHFPKDTFALAQFDGTHLYEHADPRLGEHQDWGTLIFNYARHEVRGFLVGSALSWLELFHIDGLRVDAVASMLYLDYSRKNGEWLPNQYGGRENLAAIEFLKQTNALVHLYHPGAITIAEESTSYPGVTKSIAEGGLNFDYKWNMGWMHDSLNYFKEDPLYRKYHHNKLTFGMLYHWSEAFIQSFSHDEVVHGKGSLMGKMGGGDFHNKAANLRCLLALQWAWPGKKSLFMGCEFGQIAEWSHSRSLDWHLLQYPLHEGIQKLVADLNALYKKDKTIAERDFDSQGFNWVHADDGDQSVLIFERHGYDCSWVVVGNFTPVERTYRFGVPCPGKWEEAINTDSSYYAGKGSGNLGGVVAEKIPAHSRSQSIQVCLPGLSVVIFRQKTKG